MVGKLNLQEGQPLNPEKIELDAYNRLGLTEKENGERTGPVIDQSPDHPVYRMTGTTLGSLGGSVGGTAIGAVSAILNGDPEHILWGAGAGTMLGSGAGALSVTVDDKVSCTAAKTASKVAECLNKVAEYTPEKVKKAGSDILLPRYGDSIRQETASHIVDNSVNLKTHLDGDQITSEYEFEDLPDGDYTIVIPETEQSISWRGEMPFDKPVSGNTYEIKAVSEEPCHIRGEYVGEESLPEIVSEEL